MEPASPHSLVDRCRSQAETDELTASDRAELAGSDPGDDEVGWALLTVHMSVKGAHPKNSPPTRAEVDYGRAGPGRR
jgi:hypothetical protein